MVHVELITPEKLVLSEDFDSVAAPSALGELGILANHAPLLAQLVPGELRLTRGSEVKSIAVSGGFLEVNKGSRVAVFAETAEESGQIDVERARQAEEKAKAQLNAPDLTEKDLAAIEAALTRARLRVKIGDIQRRRHIRGPQ
jgi:F-type H+-transporting ATPase subunit epsilon